MITIHKFPIILGNNETIDIIGLIAPLSVQVQRGNPCIWCLVNTDLATSKKLVLSSFVTGHEVELPSKATFLGTIQVYDIYVFHIFYEILI